MVFKAQIDSSLSENRKESSSFPYINREGDLFDSSEIKRNRVTESQLMRKLGHAILRPSVEERSFDELTKIQPNSSFTDHLRVRRNSNCCNVEPLVHKS